MHDIATTNLETIYLAWLPVKGVKSEDIDLESPRPQRWLPNCNGTIELPSSIVKMFSDIWYAFEAKQWHYIL